MQEMMMFQFPDQGPPKDISFVYRFINKQKLALICFQLRRKFVHKQKEKLRGRVGRRFDGEGTGKWGGRGSNYFQASNDMLARLIRQ